MSPEKGAFTEETGFQWLVTGQGTHMHVETSEVSQVSPGQYLQISHLPGVSEGSIQSIKLRTERSKDLLNIYKRVQETNTGYNSL